MPELFTFLIKVNIALVLFCLGYYLVLRKLTFYTLNRAYLVTAIIFSSVYPLIDLSVLAQRHQEIVAPVQNVVIIWKAPAEHLIKQAAYWNWLEVLFWAGAALFAVRLLFQLASLYKIYCRSTKQEINGQTVRVVSGDIGPFSFWRSIYINPENLSAADLDNIIAHEQVHVKEWHTLDVLLAEISVIFYWFNPGIWLMKRAVRENIEFITDRKILQKGTDSKAYQYSLLNITFNQPAPTVTSSFNFSTLKKRIKMMNAKRSSKINLTRYAFLVPAVTVSLLVLSLSKAETVKANPLYKTIATATVKTLNKLDGVIALPADTTPTPKKVTKTVIITTDGGEKPTKTINITTNQNVADVVEIKADTGSKRISYYRNLGFMGGAGINRVNIDTVNTVIINGKKATKEELMKVMPEWNRTVPTTEYRLNEIVVDGHPIKTITTNRLNGNVSEIVVNGHALTTNKNKTRSLNGNIQEVVVINDSVKYVGSNITLRAVPRFNYRLSTDTGKFRLKSDVNFAYSYITSDDKARPVSLTARGIFSSGTTDFSNKLIVIDGKEATEKALKKISVGDIGNIKELRSRAAIDKYGEKGKNGAIIITTKKK